VSIHHTIFLCDKETRETHQWVVEAGRRQHPLTSAIPRVSATYLQMLPELTPLYIVLLAQQFGMWHVRGERRVMVGENLAATPDEEGTLRGVDGQAAAARVDVGAEMGEIFCEARGAGRKDKDRKMINARNLFVAEVEQTELIHTTPLSERDCVPFGIACGIARRGRGTREDFVSSLHLLSIKKECFQPLTTTILHLERAVRTRRVRSAADHVATAEQSVPVEFSVIRFMPRGSYSRSLRAQV